MQAIAWAGMGLLLILMPTIELGEHRSSSLLRIRRSSALAQLATPEASRGRPFGLGFWHLSALPWPGCDSGVQLFGSVTNTAPASLHVRVSTYHALRWQAKIGEVRYYVTS